MKQSESEDTMLAALRRGEAFRERLPVRVPGYAEPMVPFTLKERDEIVTGWVDSEIARLRRPLTITSGEEDIDAAIDAMMPDELDRREAVEVAGYPQPMVLLTRVERHQLVSILMRLAHRLREMGDNRRLREIARRETGNQRDRFAANFTDIIFETFGLDAAAAVIGHVVTRLEETSDPQHHANANALREVLAQMQPRRPKGN